jgi:uncharacterized protein (UPF0335 family)
MTTKITNIGETSMSSEVITKEQLSLFIDKLEKLEQNKADLMEDIKSVMKEASSHGFDIGTLRKILKIKKMDQDKRQEQEELLELYMGALGI